MQRGEPFWQLRAENSECWAFTKCGEMTGARIVADKNGCPIDEGEQFGHSSRAHHLLFTGIPPPRHLIMIAGNQDPKPFVAQLLDQTPISIQWPDTNRLTRAGVHKDVSRPAG